MCNEEKVCSCFGHAEVEITEELRAKTSEAIDRAIESGVRIFLFGGRSDFDDLVYDLVSEKRCRAPQLNVKRIFCFGIGQHLQNPPWWFVRKAYDGYDCPTREMDWLHMSTHIRNIAMMERSDLVLLYAEEEEIEGAVDLAYRAYLYALQRRKPFVNLANKK